MRNFLRFSFSTKVTLALSVGLGILLALGAFGFYSVGEFLKNRQEVRRLILVKENLDGMHQDILRVEAAQARYRIAGNPSDQIAFAQLVERVQRDTKSLRSIMVMPDQIERLAQYERVAKRHFEALAESMRQPGTGDSGVAPVRANAIVDSGRELEEIAAAISGRQRQMATESGDYVETLVSLLLRLALWSGALAVALLIWTVFVINRYERDRRRAEGELASAQERLAFALAGANSAAWNWDLPHNEIYLSASWQQILGGEARESKVTPTELLGLVHPDDVAGVQAAIKGALSGTTADYSEEHRVRRADGEWIWILSRGMVVTRDENGRALRVTGTNQDVTARKTIEMELKEHDLQLQLALATAGMVRWDWDVAADTFTWPEDPWRLAGPADREGYPGLLDMVLPEDLVGFIRALHKAGQTGEPYWDEFRLTRTDGKVVWVSARGYAVRDSEGKVARIVGVAQDVSEIKQAEQALQENERELRLITDSVPAYIGYSDADERLVFCNRALAASLGAQAGELVGRTLRELYGEEVYSILQPYARRALAGEKVQFQRRQSIRGREPIDLDVSYVPRHGAHGEVEGFYALLTDITELKRLDRMKSEFVSTVSHELRTPLTSIRGSLGILAGGVAGPLSDKVRGFIDIAKDNCERLIRLINDILDMEKIESGKMSFQTQVLDLADLIDRAVRANDGFAAQHGVQLRTVSTLPGAKVQADADRLVQVLTNLISNACKFSPAQASVEIETSEHDGRVRVDVIDHGPGISEAFRGRIFQKFSQEDSSDMRQKGGTGLGLSISKAIVEGLGGEIGFDTETGKGSRFYFYLPLWREPAAAPLMRARLLVCERDADAAKRLQAMAVDAGYDADIAHTAAEARALLSERHYVALTLDLNISAGDALALMRELRADPATAGLPVIVLSPDAAAGMPEAGSGILGVVDWLSKPIDERRLIADLRSVQTEGARPRILHVEDDPDVRSVVSTIARDIGEFETATSVAEAQARLQGEKFDLVLLDLGLPDGSGWEVLSYIEGRTPAVPVVIFSAQEADHRRMAQPYAFLVKSQTSEQRLLEVIREAVQKAA